MSFTIREALPDDAESLLAHVRTVLAEPGIDIPITPEEFDISLEDERVFLQTIHETPNSRFVVAVDGEGRIIGEANLRGGRRKALQHAAERGLTVRREGRDRGVGSALSAALLDGARGTGQLKRIYLHVYARNARGIHVYEKFGFQVEGRRHAAIYQDGEYLDDLVMGLWLD